MATGQIERQIRGKKTTAALRAATLLLLAAYLPALMVYYLPFRYFWPAGLLGIGFAVLWPAILLAAALSLFIHKKTGIILMVLFLAGLPIGRHVINLSRPKKLAAVKAARTLRIMQWNCMGIPGFTPGNKYADDRRAAIAMLRQFNPDIICIQDFSTYSGSGYPGNISLLRDTLGYRYYCFDPYYYTRDFNADVATGVAVFSKLPIVDSGSLSYPGRHYPEGICWAAVSTGGSILRVVSTHLQSMHLKRPLHEIPVSFYQFDDTVAIYHAGIFGKLRHFQAYHVQEARTLKAFLDTCSGPFVVGADLNSVPASYVYSIVSPRLQDAFCVAGSGVGATYHTRPPGIRIDYLFAGNSIKIMSFLNHQVRIYDHNPQVMDILIP